MNKRSYLTMLTLSAGLSFNAAAQQASVIPMLDTCYRNISYTGNNDSLQMLDVWLVKNRNAHTPVIVLIHGGGWAGGNKSDVRDYAAYFVNQGVNVVAINYRLTTGIGSGPRCKDIIDDVRKSILFTHSHAKQWNIRSKSYVLWGGSAGAHLALYYAYEFDKENYVSAAVGLGTPAKLNDTCWNTIPVYRYVAGLALSRFLGFQWVGDTANRQVIDASPYYAKTFKPTMMIHGQLDSVVPRSQAELMYEKLKQKHVDCQYILLHNGDHIGGGASKEDIIKAMEASVAWVRKYTID
jgi:acetyl esterase/lipase